MRLVKDQARRLSPAHMKIFGVGSNFDDMQEKYSKSIPVLDKREGIFV